MADCTYGVSGPLQYSVECSASFSSSVVSSTCFMISASLPSQSYLNPGLWVWVGWSCVDFRALYQPLWEIVVVYTYLSSSGTVHLRAGLE